MTISIGPSTSNISHSKGFLRNVKHRYYRVDQNVLGNVIKFCEITESRYDIKPHAEYKEHFKFIYCYSLSAPCYPIDVSNTMLPPPYRLQQNSALYRICKMPLQLTNKPTYPKPFSNPHRLNPKAVTSGENGAPKVVPCNRSLTSTPFSRKYYVQSATEFILEPWRWCVLLHSRYRLCHPVTVVGGN